MLLAVFLTSLLTFLALGIPIAFSIFLTVIMLIFTCDVGNINIIGNTMYQGVNSFSLMAIPFFILSGELMNEGKLSQVLVNFCRVLIGHVKGGLGYVMVLACMMFACLSGAAMATVSAIGGILLPLLIAEGYNRSESTALACAGACVGPIIPPSIPMVVFGVASGVSATKLFIGGAIPGVIVSTGCMVYWYYLCHKRNYKVSEKSSWGQVGKATVKAVPTLMMPAIMMGGMITGIFTPTEAGVIAVVYAWAVATFLYKKMNMATLKKCLVSAAKGTAVVMFVICASQVLASIITLARVPQMIKELLMNMSSSPIVIGLVINVIVLLVGCFMDTVPALTILTPVFLPVIKAVGIDPVAFGVTLVFGLVIGLITPPVGAVLYIGCDLTKINILDLCRKVVPLLIVWVAVLTLITIFPGIVTFLPNLLI